MPLALSLRFRFSPPPPIILILIFHAATPLQPFAAIIFDILPPLMPLFSRRQIIAAAADADAADAAYIIAYAIAFFLSFAISLSFCR
jgi:hypothetical protein